jgi:hypothetical protein
VALSLQESHVLALEVVYCAEPLVERVSARVKLSTDVVTVSVTFMVP